MILLFQKEHLQKIKSSSLLSFEGDNEKTTIHFVAERFNSAVFTKAN
jgi:hypothetical protein